MITRWFCWFAVVCLLAMPVRAQDEGGAATDQTTESAETDDGAKSAAEDSDGDAQRKADAEVDPCGTWTWDRDFGGNRFTMYVRIKDEPKKLAGTYQMVPEDGAENMPPEALKPTPLREAKLKGDELSFQVVRSFGDREFTIDFSGTIHADQLTGQVEMGPEDQRREFPWTAKRVVTAADVVGRWTIRFQTQQGPTESAFTIAKGDGDKLRGTYDSQYFGEAPISQIQLKGDELSFAVTFGGDDRQVTAKYAAQPRGDRIKGTITLDFGGDQRETPFTGQRVPPPKEPATSEEASREATPATQEEPAAQ